MSKLQLIQDSLPIIQETYSEDVTFLLIDTEKVLAFVPGRTASDVKIPVGTPLEHLAGTITVKALKEGKRLREERGPEQYGTAYVGTAAPIFEDGQLVGVLTSLVHNHKLEALRSGAIELSSVLEEMSATTEMVAKSSMDVTKQLQELKEESNRMKGDIKKVSGVLELVQEIAAQSHLLGLNAAIEAVRAGDYGRGFSVVADEIRKMAEHSKGSVKEIQNQMTHIYRVIEQINQSIEQIATYTSEYSASMQEMNSAFAHITDIAMKLTVAAESA